MSNPRRSFDWTGLNEPEVRKKFENLSPYAAAALVEFRWDLSNKEVGFYEETPAEYLEVCSLFSCPSSHFVRLLHEADNYRRFKGYDRNNLLRLLGHLDRGGAVSPPSLKQIPGGKLLTHDGFHRISLALASGARIYFLAVLDEKPDLVREESPLFPFRKARSDRTVSA